MSSSGCSDVVFCEHVSVEASRTDWSGGEGVFHVSVEASRTGWSGGEGVFDPTNSS